MNDAIAETVKAILMNESPGAKEIRGFVGSELEIIRPHLIEAQIARDKYKEQLAEAQKLLRNTEYNDYLKKRVEAARNHQKATKRSYDVQVKHLKADLKEARDYARKLGRELKNGKHTRDYWHGLARHRGDKLSEAAEQIQLAGDTIVTRDKRIEELEDALKQVEFNWRYQKRTGGRYFTSAPTEMDCKKSEKEQTEKMVADALQKKKKSE